MEHFRLDDVHVLEIKVRIYDSYAYINAEIKEECEDVNKYKTHLYKYISKPNIIEKIFCNLDYESKIQRGIQKIKVKAVKQLKNVLEKDRIQDIFK